MPFELAPSAAETTSAATPKSARICDVSKCGRPVQWRKWCCTHYGRWLKTGEAAGDIKRLAPRGSGYRRSDGYLILDFGGVKKLAHVAIAEKAIGKPLPSGAEVHHVDQDPTNNSPSNLVICPDAAYHKLLHQRQRAFDACGHYGWRKCQFCQQYDDPANMWTSRKKACHRACGNAARAAYNKAKKGTKNDF